MIYENVTLVYTTFNRCEQFERSLRRLVRLGSIPEEIIIVNDGSQDNTEKMVAEVKSQTGLPIRYFYRNNPVYDICSVPRNIAVRRAKGEIFITSEPEVLFVDDIIPLLLEEMKKHPRDIITATDVYFTNPATKIDEKKIIENPQELIENEWDIEPFPVGFYASYPAHTVTHSTDLVAPFCAAYRTEWIKEIGGWDEDFIGYAFDDIDYLTRLRIRGHGQQRNGELTIIHQWHERPPGDRAALMALNEKKFLAKELDKGGPDGPNVVANKGKEWGMPELEEKKL